MPAARYATDAWRQKLSAACAAHARLGPDSLVLYDVSTLYSGDRRGRRVPRERVLQGGAAGAQITVGLLADQGGFPLMVSAFEGNIAERKTMLPVIKAFMAAHQLPGVIL